MLLATLRVIGLLEDVVSIVLDDADDAAPELSSLDRAEGTAPPNAPTVPNPEAGGGDSVVVASGRCVGQYLYCDDVSLVNL